MPPLSHIPSSPSPSNPGVSKKPSQVQTENIVKPMAISVQSLRDKSLIRLSPDSQNMRTRQNQMNELPEIREDRISQLQQAIKNGTYAVSAEQLAEKLIQEL